MLTQEFRNVSTYNDIIGAIASGVNKVNEIADKAHVEQSVAVHALQNLIATGSVLKGHAITDESNKKKVQYVLRGSVFEEICRHYTLICGVEGKWDCFVANVGRWWGTQARRREKTD